MPDTGGGKTAPDGRPPQRTATPPSRVAAINDQMQRKLFGGSAGATAEGGAGCGVGHGRGNAARHDEDRAPRVTPSSVVTAVEDRLQRKLSGGNAGMVTGGGGGCGGRNSANASGHDEECWRLKMEAGGSVWSTTSTDSLLQRKLSGGRVSDMAEGGGGDGSRNSDDAAGHGEECWRIKMEGGDGVRSMTSVDSQLQRKLSGGSAVATAEGEVGGGGCHYSGDEAGHEEYQARRPTPASVVAAFDDQLQRKLSGGIAGATSEGGGGGERCNSDNAARLRHQMMEVKQKEVACVEEGQNEAQRTGTVAFAVNWETSASAQNKSAKSSCWVAERQNNSAHSCGRGVVHAKYAAINDLDLSNADVAGAVPLNSSCPKRFAEKADSGRCCKFRNVEIGQEIEDANELPVEYGEEEAEHIANEPLEESAIHQLEDAMVRAPQPPQIADDVSPGAIAIRPGAAPTTRPAMRGRRENAGLMFSVLEGEERNAAQQTVATSQKDFVATGAFLVDSEGAENSNRPRVVSKEATQEEQVYEGIAVPSSQGIEDQADDPSQGQSIRRRRCILLFVILLCVAAATIVGVTVASNRGSGNTLPETTPENEAPVSRKSTIKSALGAILGDGTTQALRVESSPQYKALVWLSDQDRRQLDPKDKKSLVQRFILAAFYFATGGECWNEQASFMSDEHECSWNTRVQCAGSCEGIFDTGTLIVHNDFLGVQCLGDSVTVGGIRFYENNLTGSLPAEIGALADLEYLMLLNKGISGSVPSAMGNLSSLHTLYLYSDCLSGTLPTELGHLSNLESLRLFSKHLNGTVFTEIGNMVNLKVLGLENNISGSIPTEIGFLEYMEDLSFAENLLTGTIPTEISGMSNLRKIQLQMNHLRGTIPWSSLNAEVIRDIRVNANQLSGMALPPEVGYMKKLEVLELQHNQLSGTIPGEIGNLAHLQKLALGLNKMQGTLPESMGNLTQLELLVLDRNMFSGTVPSTLSNLESLLIMTLSNTSLTGNINSFCGKLLIALAADCYGENPEVVCECCNFCCSDVVQGDVDLWDIVKTISRPVDLEQSSQDEVHWKCFYG